MTPQEYQARRQARIDRLRDRADRRRAEGQGRIERADAMASIIPLGQPILVGHHSEKRDRRYRDRIHDGFSRGFTQLEEAKALERRAAAAEDNAAISSDDPEAIDRLREKLAGIEKKRARYRDINRTIRTIRAAGKKTGQDWKEPAIAALVKLGLSARNAADLLEPDFANRVGVPDYMLANASAEARRLETRIADLERRQNAPEPEPEEIGAVRLVPAGPDCNRIRLYFPGKPAESIRAALKRAGFRWTPTEGAWQAFPNAWALQEARRIAALAGEGGA